VKKDKGIVEHFDQYLDPAKLSQLGSAKYQTYKKEKCLEGLITRTVPYGNVESTTTLTAFK
jgi:hypothetical protein